jgi:hypothetical protein
MYLLTSITLILAAPCYVSFLPPAPAATAKRKLAVGIGFKSEALDHLM